MIIVCVGVGVRLIFALVKYINIIYRLILPITLTTATLSRWLNSSNFAPFDLFGALFAGFKCEIWRFEIGGLLAEVVDGVVGVQILIEFLGFGLRDDLHLNLVSFL